MEKFEIGDRIRFSSLLGDIEGDIIEIDPNSIFNGKKLKRIRFKITKFDKQPESIGKTMYVDAPNYWRVVKLNENKMKKSELKQLIKEVIQEGEITHGYSTSELASECLSLLASPYFSKFLSLIDDMELVGLYNNLYNKLKDYEIWKQS